MTSKPKSRAWFFTWNNPGRDILEQIDDIFGHTEYVCQLEEGTEGTKHLQGVIRFPNPRVGPGEALFKCCHWERCRSWRKAKVYCSKVVTRIAGPWTNVKGLTWKATLRRPIREFKPLPFQREILEIIKTEPDFRTIHWYWSKQGRMGKTSFARELKIRRPGTIYLNGSGRDILCYFMKCNSEMEVDIEIAILGATRQQAERLSYSSLEVLKDGIGFSGKYEPTDGVWNPPHVFVFANFPPNRDLLSEDRWHVVNVDIEA